MLDTVYDVLKDSLNVFPYLLLIYILIEVIESVTAKESIERAMSSNGAPIVAGALGVVPECGFSVMCAKLYENGLIKMGTLIAAFIATSDEGLVVLISKGVDAVTVLLFIFWKLLFAVFVGEILNITLKDFGNKHKCPDKDDCVECGEHHGEILDKFLMHPFNHAAKTFFYVLFLNFVFGFAFYFIGEEGIIEFTANSEALQPLLSGLVGLIPNCASSIVIAESYINNILSFSGLVAGLSTNAGLGLMILFKGGKNAKNVKNLKNALLVALLLFVSGVALGYLTMLG